MFRASPRQSSGAYNYTGSLWFYRWKEEARGYWSWSGRPVKGLSLSFGICPTPIPVLSGPGSLAGIGTGYGLDGPGIESR